MAPFTLDPRLASDTVHAGRFSLCRVLVMNDANYPWFILVPERSGVTELYELDAADQRQLLAEVSEFARAVARAFGARKMNIAALGNVVPQLHVHVIARKADDPAWPAPVWGRVPARRYGEAELARVIAAVRGALSSTLAWADPRGEET